MDKEKVKKVAQAIALLRDHGECYCTHCEIAKAVIAANPEIAESLRPLSK